MNKQLFLNCHSTLKLPLKELCLIHIYLVYHIRIFTEQSLADLQDLAHIFKILKKLSGSNIQKYFIKKTALMINQILSVTEIMVENVKP